MVDAVGIEQRGAAPDAADFMTFFQQKPGKIGTVLASNVRDECLSGHGVFVVIKVGNLVMELMGDQLAPPGVPMMR